jgi:hypothetical protein
MRPRSAALSSRVFSIDDFVIDLLSILNVFMQPDVKLAGVFSFC